MSRAGKSRGKNKGKSKVPSLGTLFMVSVASALLSVILQDFARDWAQPYFATRIPLGASYGVLFIVLFLILSFVSHHLSVRFSAQPQGMETADGSFVPRLARFVLVCFVFGAPLFFLPGQMTQQDKMSLQALIENRVEPSAGGEVGYKKTDRDQLESIIHKGALDDY